MKSLVLALTASILAAGSANAGMTFVESYTDATLGDGDELSGTKPMSNEEVAKLYDETMSILNEIGV